MSPLRRVTATVDRYEVDISLPDELFPVGIGGIQHLIGILAGDVLPSATGSIRWHDARITAFEFSDGLRQDAVARFRPTAHSIAQIRQTFGLPEDRPLLAFTFKPRVGVSLDQVKAIATGLAAAGFNIVEFDTRRLEDPEVHLDEWVGIQEAMAASANGRPVAFSPNLSIRTDIAVRTARAWCERTRGHPTTLKVDGGLDGLSTIQAIRETITDNPPIITCYPSLRKSLAPFLGGPDNWVDFLAISGADIIYPGGRPNFTDDRGRLVAGEDLEKSVKQPQSHYGKLLDQGWPMPSFAAGPHAGDLHVAQQLLGGGTAMFLGEALTASRDGTLEAGRYISQMVDATAKQIGAARRGKLEYLPHELLLDYTKHYPADTFIEYSKIFDDQGKATPWWKRSG